MCWKKIPKGTSYNPGIQGLFIYGEKMPILNILGKKFNRLTVIYFVEVSGRYSRWQCRCDCGNTTIVRGNSLKAGEVKSCGCLAREKSKIPKSKTHGMSKTPEYITWNSMKERCYNTNNKGYKDYGARGIKVCDKWLHSFENFYKDMGKRPTNKHTIERINNHKGYSPENCKWATMKEQGRNKRNNHLITFKGETKTISQWSEILNIKYRILEKRINRFHWSIEKSLTTPIRKTTKNRYLTFHGETLPLHKWADVLGIKRGTLHNRIYHLNWPIEKAFNKTISE